MNEQFSQWLDGELDDDSWAEIMATVQQHEEWQEKWHTYHLIGDTLRGMPAHSTDFASKFATRLAQEPTVLAPAQFNNRKSRWQGGLSVAAALAGFVAVGLGASHTLWQVATPVAPAVNLAQQTVTQPINDYMLAHQQLASHGEPIEQPIVVAYNPAAGH